MENEDLPTFSIQVTMPWGEVRVGKYRWLEYGEEGADGMTLRIVKWERGDS